jgi:hypothetical protein
MFSPGRASLVEFNWIFIPGHRNSKKVCMSSRAATPWMRVDAKISTSNAMFNFLFSKVFALFVGRVL